MARTSTTPPRSVLLRAKGDGDVVLITDGMPLAGTPDGEGEWEGVPIRVEGGKAVRVADGTIIGGVITLDQMVRNAAKYMSVSRARALDMASTAAIRALRLDVEPWHDFILLDDEATSSRRGSPASASTPPAREPQAAALVRTAAN